MMRSRLFLFPLFHDMQMVTEGTSLTVTSRALDLPQLKTLLPQAEALILFWNTVGRTANFEWNVFLIPGFDREHEAAPADLAGGYINTVIPGRNDYTTSSSFQLHGRLEARWRNASGASGVNSALGSAVLGVKTVGM